MSTPVSEPLRTAIVPTLPTSSVELEAPASTRHGPSDTESGVGNTNLVITTPGLQLQLYNIESAIAALRHEVRAIQHSSLPGQINYEKVDGTGPRLGESDHPDRLPPSSLNAPVVEEGFVPSTQPRVASAASTREQDTIPELLQQLLRVSERFQSN